MYIKYMMGVLFCCNEIIWGKAAGVHQAHDTEQPDLFYMMIGLTHHEKQKSCT